MGRKRKYYWNPCASGKRFVDERNFVYGFDERQPAGVWRERHFHESWGELLVMCEGSCTLLTEQGTFLVNGHQCVWCPSQIEHEFHTLEPSYNRTLFIHDSAMADCPSFSSCQTIPLTPLLRELILAVHDMQLDLARQEDALIARVLIDTLKRTPPVASILRMPRSPLLQEFCHGILSQLDSPVSIEKFCRQLEMSEKAFYRFFFRETGVSFARWLQLARLDCARFRLIEGKDVTEAAFSSGYSSVSSFIVAFRRQFGVTPGRMLKRHSGKDGA